MLVLYLSCLQCFSHLWNLLLINDISVTTMIVIHVDVCRPGADIVSASTDIVSMWVKIVSSWVCLLIYFWSLIAPLILKNRDFD